MVMMHEAGKMCGDGMWDGDGKARSFYYVGGGIWEKFGAMVSQRH